MIGRRDGKKERGQEGKTMTMRIQVTKQRERTEKSYQINHFSTEATYFSKLRHPLSRIENTVKEGETFEWHFAVNVVIRAHRGIQRAVTERCKLTSCS